MSEAVRPLIAGLHDAGDLRDSAPLLAEPQRLRRRLGRDGYLLLRGLIPAPRILTVRGVLMEMMRGQGWLADGATAATDMPLEGEPRYLALYRRVLHHPEFSGLARAPEMLSAAAAALGGEVQVHKRIIGRLVAPRQPPTQPHQDFHYIRGTPDTLTAWIPLGDALRGLGGLAVLPGSHRRGFIPHRRTTGAGGFGVETAGLPGPWLSADYRAGDVLLFPSCTIHAALPNQGGSVRLSADFRYQRAGEAIDPDSLRHHYHLD